jgi:hypothetical protein
MVVLLENSSSIMLSFDLLNSAESATVNFLDLPKGIRNDIYEKVLAVPHPLYLF